MEAQVIQNLHVIRRDWGKGFHMEWQRSHTRGKDLSISAEPEGVDGVSVSLQLSNHESMANVPQENSAISGPWSQELPTGGEIQCVNRPLWKTTYGRLIIKFSSYMMAYQLYFSKYFPLNEKSHSAP